MKSRDELRNDYEEALFAIIMDDIMELEGEALLAERERLMESDESKVPDHVNERCMQVINSAFDENKKGEKKRKTRKIWRTILIAALISCLGFMTAYASVPAIKVATNKFIVTVFDKNAKMIFGEVVNASNSSDYVFGFIPDGFEIIQETKEENVEWIKYVFEDSKMLIRINYNCSNRELSADSENADIVEAIEVNEFNGLLVVKDNKIHAVVADMQEENNIIQIIVNDMDLQTVVKIIENIRRND